MKPRYSLFLFFLLAFGSACRKDHAVNRMVLLKLHREYRSGEISTGFWQGNRVYVCALNAYDAGSTVYNEKGSEIGSCNYAWGSVDPVCEQVSGAEVIYRVYPNIWGKPRVNRYRLPQ